MDTTDESAVLAVARSYLAQAQTDRDDAYAEYLKHKATAERWLDEIERIESPARASRK